jgi:hypothetical protein
MEFNGKHIETLTVPKGTLLFRAVKNSETDLVGAHVAAGKLCIPSNYNVFFYTSPFVVDGVHWFDDGFPNVDAYVVPHDLKLVSMIKPSKLTRSSRKEKGQIVESCSVQDSCLKGREYDPCFKPEFLEQFPDVHGWIAVTAADSKEVLEAIKQKKLDSSTITLVEDDRKVRGPPEIALYPLKTRSLTDLIIEHPEEMIASKQGEYNYKHVVTLKRHCDDRSEFLRTRAKYDNKTGFYMYTETFAVPAKIPKGETVMDESKMLSKIEMCIRSKNSVSKPDIPDGLPPVSSDGPWEISTTAAKRTIDYLIGKLHHACYVLCVSGGKGELFKIERRQTAEAFKKALFGKKTLRNPPTPAKQWRVLQCHVREYADEDSFSSEYAQFIKELKHPLPNGSFIMNLTDAVVLRKDGTEPWPMVTGSAPLEDKFKGKFLPIMCGSGHDEYWDVPIPNYDDVRIALGRDKDMAFLEWEKKQDKAVFRGAPTGCGYTPDTNMRIKLAMMKSDDMDVGVVTTKSQNLKFDPKDGLGRLDVSASLQAVERLTLKEQAAYKYIFHIDGNVAAYRLLKMMTLGSVILKVKGPYTTWVDRVLEDKVHYVSVKEDLSDVEEVLEWCKTHDSECKTIATTAREFALTALKREFVESTFANTVWEFATSSPTVAIPKIPR